MKHTPREALLPRRFMTLTQQLIQKSDKLIEACQMGIQLAIDRDVLIDMVGKLRDENAKLKAQLSTRRSSRKNFSRGGCGVGVPAKKVSGSTPESVNPGATPGGRRVSRKANVNPSKNAQSHISAQ
jgi:hypothetical protein